MKGRAIGEEYYQKHSGIIEGRIEQASIRLAGLLNVLLKDGLSTGTTDDKAAASSQPSSPRICDKVYGSKVLEGSEMTLINLGGVYPNQKLTIMIKGKDRAKFKRPPEEIFANKQICVTGTVVEYKGKPEIIVSDPSQIEIK